MRSRAQEADEAASALLPTVVLSACRQLILAVEHVGDALGALFANSDRGAVVDLGDPLFCRVPDHPAFCRLPDRETHQHPIEEVDNGSYFARRLGDAWSAHAEFQP